MEKQWFVYIFDVKIKNIGKLLFSAQELLQEKRNIHEKKTIKQFIRMVNDGEFDNKKYQAAYLTEDVAEPSIASKNTQTK